MDNFVVSFRKYRPDTFSSVVGQAHITDTLKNAILLNQLAQAFLFCGPRGVGKTTCARILAKAVNCTQLTPEGDPCNTCPSCKAFNEGKSIIIHEMDAASNNSVEDIRNLIEQIRFIPPNGARAVYIIDEVHMLSSSAFNAFLKTLEEPPPYAIFILATTEKHKILPTILSRCQKFDFRRIKIEDMTQHLASIADKENIPYEKPALQLISLKADGALRDALSLFDQVSAFSNRNITYSATLENLNILDYDYYFKIQKAISARDHAKALLIYQEVIDKGFDGYNFTAGLLEHFRNLLMAAEPRTVELLQTSDNIRQTYLEASKSLNESFLLNAFQLCSDTELKYRNSASPNLLVELLLIKLVYLEDAIHLAGKRADDPDGGPEEKKKPESPELISGAEPQKKTETHSNAVSIEIQTAVQEKAGSDILQNTPKINSPNTNARPLNLELNSGMRRLSSIPKSLDDLSEKMQVEKDLEPEEEERDSIIPVEPDKFAAAYNALCDFVEKNHSMSLATQLREKRWTLEIAVWKHKVADHVQKIMMEDARSMMVEFLRNHCGHHGLRLEIDIEAPKTDEVNYKPYTSEERLKYIEEKFPLVSEFIRKHQGQISYE